MRQGTLSSFVRVIGLLCGGIGSAHAAPCYIAFLHGSGEKFDLADSSVPSPVAAYWTPDGTATRSFVAGAARASDPAARCTTELVGYDGNAEWWSDRAAGRVAAAIKAFAAREKISDGGLVVVGHSMGGLVARYVVNNGSPGAAYYNEYAWRDPDMDYDVVRRKTAYVVTVQSPHTGAQGADALYGTADRRLANTSAGLIKVLGIRDVTNATAVMTRAYLEAAGASGGEMGDEGRAVPLYTIAGTSAGPGSGLGMEADEQLDLAWSLLCYQKGAANSWGLGCRWDFWNFQPTPGDGLVEQASAHGLWTRQNVNGQGGIAGARRTWLDVEHNHNQARYDAHAARIHDHLRGAETRSLLGTYIGTHGLALPPRR